MTDSSCQNRRPAMERSMINKIWKTVIDNADTYVRLLKIDAYCDELGCISLDSSGDESFSSGWDIKKNFVFSRWTIQQGRYLMQRRIT